MSCMQLSTSSPKGYGSRWVIKCPSYLLASKYKTMDPALCLKPRPSFRNSVIRSSTEESDASTPTITTQSNEESVTKEQAKRQDTEATTPQSHPLIDKELKDEFDALVRELNDSSRRGKRGEGLLLAHVVIYFLMLFPPLKIKGALELFGTLAITAGVVFTLYGLLSLAKNFSPLPEPRKNHKLVVTGMYSYVRHPLYGGSILGGIGLAVLTRNETRLAFTALLWWILEHKAAWEERALLARYPEYALYREKVKKFIPFLY